MATNITTIFKSIDKTHVFDSKETDILEKNHQFFTYNVKYMDLLLQIINGESQISIRILDWFVANYSKKHNTCYKIKINGNVSHFYVYNEYKNQLNGFSKFYFDPFCRKHKIVYHYVHEDRDINFITSIGQLNFFKWAILHKIIVHVTKNLPKIEFDMKETNKENKRKKIEMQQNRTTIDFVEEESDPNPDPIICSSEKISSICISSNKKSTSTTKSESDSLCKRRQLSKSVYEYGIKKSCIPIRLEFD